jgi:hypothetical protein
MLSLWRIGLSRSNCAQAGPGEDRPRRAVRVLPAVFAHARRIALDIAGVFLAVIERRGEQLGDLVRVIDQQPVDRSHRLLGVRAVGRAGDHAPRLGDGVDLAFVAFA